MRILYTIVYNYAMTSALPFLEFLLVRQKVRFMPLAYLHPAVRRQVARPIPLQWEDPLRTRLEEVLRFVVRLRIEAIIIIYIEKKNINVLKTRILHFHD